MATAVIAHAAASASGRIAKESRKLEGHNATAAAAATPNQNDFQSRRTSQNAENASSTLLKAETMAPPRAVSVCASQATPADNEGYRGLALWYGMGNRGGFRNNSQCASFT